LRVHRFGRKSHRRHPPRRFFTVRVGCSCSANNKCLFFPAAQCSHCSSTANSHTRSATPFFNRHNVAIASNQSNVRVVNVDNETNYQTLDTKAPVK
jgi:hypothetical protein